jgi:hypothetical protein
MGVAERQRIGENGRAYYREHLSMSEGVRHMESVFEAAIATPWLSTKLRAKPDGSRGTKKLDKPRGFNASPAGNNAGGSPGAAGGPQVDERPVLCRQVRRFTLVKLLTLKNTTRPGGIASCEVSVRR